VDNSDLRQTDNSQLLLLQHDSKIIAEGHRMCNREEQTFGQSSNRIDEEDKHFQQSRFLDIHSRDGFTLESTISELEQELINGMAKLEIQNVNNLSEKIQQTEKRIKDCREVDSKEDAEKEIENLTQLKHLTILDDMFTKLKLTQSVEDSSSVMKLCQLEQELINGLATLKVDDVNNLSEKIQQTEERIKECREVDRKEDANKEMEILKQLKHLTILEVEITKLKSTQSVEGSSSAVKPRRFERESVSGLTNFNVYGVKKLSAR
jgi:hypothetical protein